MQQAVDTFGRIDGVVCVAGILRERMLFNMSEDEWDPVIETHLKGTFTVFRAAAPVVPRSRRAARCIGFTSGAFAASVAQANYSAAKGGIVSLVRSAAAGMYKYGVTANCIAPVAKSRMSGNVPFGLEMGEPEDIAPMVCFLLSDHAREVTGQVYTVNDGRVAVWNQPVEVREMRKDGRWTVDELAARFDEVGQEPMPILDRAEGDGERGEERRQAEPVSHERRRAARLEGCTGGHAARRRLRSDVPAGRGHARHVVAVPRRGVRRVAADARRLPRPAR